MPPNLIVLRNYLVNDFSVNAIIVGVVPPKLFSGRHNGPNSGQELLLFVGSTACPKFSFHSCSEVANSASDNTGAHSSTTEHIRFVHPTHHALTAKISQQHPDFYRTHTDTDALSLRLNYIIFSMQNGRKVGRHTYLYVGTVFDTAMIYGNQMSVNDSRQITT